MYGSEIRSVDFGIRNNGSMDLESEIMDVCSLGSEVMGV